MQKDIIRNKDDLTPEMLQKIKIWISGLTKNDFLNAKYENKHIALEKKLETVQVLGDILKFGEANNEKVIRFGEIFMVDSKYASGDLCIVQHLKSRKDHKVLHRLASNYENYSCGYFAIPSL